MRRQAGAHVEGQDDKDEEKLAKEDVPGSRHTGSEREMRDTVGGASRGADRGCSAPDRGGSWDGSNPAPGHQAGGASSSSAIASTATSAAIARAAPSAEPTPMVRDTAMQLSASQQHMMFAHDLPANGSAATNSGSSRVDTVAPGLRLGDPAYGSSLLSGQPTGSESEPWSMMGSFEDLLNGLVSDEPDEEETTLPGSSRFARFFSSSPLDESISGTPASGPSALASLGGIKLDPPFEPSGGKQQDDWQQGENARCAPC